MNWRRWAAIGLTGAAAIAAISLFPRTDNDARPRNQIAKLSVPKPAEEQQLKQNMLRRDVTATERLYRLDAKGHLRTLASDFAQAPSGKLPNSARELQKDHKQFQAIFWY
ncbi:MAG: peptidase S8, partial [Paenibacillus macerans]|nr:peptidase S8 [Paenibacillus macerans]